MLMMMTTTVTTETTTTTLPALATVRLECVAKTNTETAHKQAQCSKPSTLPSPSSCRAPTTTTTTTTTATTNVAQQPRRDASLITCLAAAATVTCNVAPHFGQQCSLSRLI
ncbi:uncharacterized protein Dmoj_GI26764 [Drosophila mojavensis]|uniref:Uncharacterized protein n=1 Tax=Drosophila mojavensis TaxID=7230 RepID=A0A0Q9XAH4_DROMO|nr:uncharacterized protein Dmoj_GI26764 [Drosophila mojavensis]